VLPAASGAEALAILQRDGPDARPDALICDIAMPEEDGYQTLRRVRSWEASHGDRVVAMPAIALTAHAQREDRIRALACSYAMQLTKPAAPAELLMVIATLVGKARAQLA
jgi:CheY-like chemotaxis protein